MKPAEVEVHREEGEGCLVVRQLLREAARQPVEPPYMGPNAEVCTLHD